ncbi:hypothetical protein B9T13_06115 [Wohlfahrtiimonas chitiniclastica]|uniref:helicase-related protein n=1 Tax=Wohlfahrtiimonas chitiniclastica TaxID=400946 RepID=UPI000B998B9F|nr:DEAD/DEAH box helicase [Wohlfahrtiimonas chitiniclastica]OYQ70835.1 hypothetical protein B9T13_06115 [Wohlfahrtiimonas chitiniclastica]
MSKKVNISLCDALSDHIQQAVDLYPELEPLHFTSVLNKDVLQLLRNDHKALADHRRMIVVANSVSECFDVAILLANILGQESVAAVYPHTVADHVFATSVIVAPMMAFQIGERLTEEVLQASHFVMTITPEGMNEMAAILEPCVTQLLADCKILPLMSVALSDSVQTSKEAAPIVLEVEPMVDDAPEIVVKAQSDDKAMPEIKVFVEPEPEAVRHEIDASTAEAGHHIVLVDRNYKRAYLRNVLKGSDEKTLVITRTRHNAHRLEEYLYQGKVRSRILHANLSEEAKEKVIEQLQSGELKVLLLPESVAQTTDLSDIGKVIFFDLPDVGIEFKARVETFGEKFNVPNTISIVTNDETPWIDAMESELKWTLPIVQAAPPQRSHNILRLKDRNNKEKPEKTEKRGRGLRKLGGKNTQKKRNTPFGQRPMKPAEHEAPYEAQPQDISHHNEDPFNSNHGNSIVNENRNPFAFDSFEASVARQNKKRVKQLFSRREAPARDVQDDFNSPKPVKKSVKVVHRKKRVFDIDGNQ